MAFRLPLTQAQRDEIAAERRFAHECFETDDVRLGGLILNLAVGLRATHPVQFPGDRLGGYSDMLVWEVAPEVARRLGVRDFARKYRPYALRDADALSLRVAAGNAIFGSRIGILGPDGKLTDPQSLSLLQREPCNGNPLVIGLDRVAAPTDDPADLLARRLAEVSARRGFPSQTSWSPAMEGRRDEPADAVPAPGP